MKEGVKSTTRYRKTSSNKKGIKPEHPAPQRQRSGAKGGRAAKKAARQKRSLRQVARRSYPQAYGNTGAGSPHTSEMDRDDFLAMASLNPTDMEPYCLETLGPSPLPSFAAPRNYRLEDIVGFSHGLSDDPLFYDDVDTPSDVAFSTVTPSECSDAFLGGLGCVG